MSEIVFDDRAVPPSPPDAGEVSFYSIDGKPEYMLQDGIRRTFETTYGGDVETISEFYTDTSTSTAFKTYGGTTYPAGLAVAGRKYKISFCLLSRYSSNGRNFICRVALDGATLEQEIANELKDAGSDIRVPTAYFYIIDGADLNNAGGFLDVDYRCQQGGDTATVYSCTLEFVRIK